MALRPGHMKPAPAYVHRLTLLLSGALIVAPVISAVAQHQPSRRPSRQVLLWTSYPCTTHWPWPTKCNSTMLASFLQILAPLRGIVDRVAVNGYYLADPNSSNVAQSGGVVRLGEDLPAIVAALQQAGFEVEPLVGNGPPMQYSPPDSLPQQVGSSIDRFRPYLREPVLRAGLARAFANEVSALNLSGLNWDFEFSDCGPDCSSTPHCGRTGSARCNTTTDGAGLNQLITETQRVLATTGARLSVDVGQCPLTWGNWVNASGADTLITMGTYYDLKSFTTGLQGGLIDFGVGRLGVGLCPKCLQNSPQMQNRTVDKNDIDARFGELSRAGIEEIDVFNLDSNQPFGTPPWGVNSTEAEQWWDAIREWKTDGQDTITTSTVL
eukprot:COSAG02_NODE_4149_length_5710_cov_6.668330_2_plen_381_part_00